MFSFLSPLPSLLFNWKPCSPDSSSLNIFQDEPSQKATPESGTEASPVRRRGRPPKSAATPAAAEKDGAAASAGGVTGRGRKRAADSNLSGESINIKMSKQQLQNDEGTKRQIDLQR